ncbi:hypothetical protein CCO02nite_00650 [Cellulomonas composti]|uniref:Polyketide cyclase n=1 Tax=Cellulomonas composti TaxID=266130 RepID=A0A511J5Y5_9CELL|nr:hypothetical protein CCO02nite_00650 [Cellulomonas composti]
MLIAGLAAVVVPLARTWALQWGATDDDLDADLPGDELVPDPLIGATRAITIDAPPEQVWPWVVQLGLGRGGFYSYDRLERAFGLDVHSADRVEQRWQSLAVGDAVHLGPEVALEVVRLDRNAAMVLAAPDSAWVWAFVLRPGRYGTTRLVVRERYARLGWWSRAAFEVLGVASTVMSRAMLRGIRDRVQGARGPEVP